MSLRGHQLSYPKGLADTVKESQPLNDEIVAELVMNPLRGCILKFNNLLFIYHAPFGLWQHDDKPALVL